MSSCFRLTVKFGIFKLWKKTFAVVLFFLNDTQQIYISEQIKVFVCYFYANNRFVWKTIFNWKSLYLIFGSEKFPQWCSWKENTAENKKPSQSITTNTNKAQSKSAELTVRRSKIPPAIPLLVKQQHPDAWINVATNNCNVSDCERCHALPDALLRRNRMLM